MKIRQIYKIFVIAVAVTSNAESFAQTATDKHACINSNGVLSEQDYGYLEFGQDDGNEGASARKFYKSIEKAYPEILKRAKKLATKVCKENPKLKKSKITGIRAEVSEVINDELTNAKYFGVSDGAYFCCK